MTRRRPSRYPRSSGLTSSKAVSKAEKRRPITTVRGLDVKQRMREVTVLHRANITRVLFATTRTAKPCYRFSETELHLLQRERDEADWRPQGAPTSPFGLLRPICPSHCCRLFPSRGASSGRLALRSMFLHHGRRGINSVTGFFRGGTI